MQMNGFQKPLTESFASVHKFLLLNVFLINIWITSSSIIDVFRLTLNFDLQSEASLNTMNMFNLLKHRHMRRSVPVLN